MKQTPKGEVSKVERAKAGSRWLRGGLGAELADPTGAFGDDDVQVLKFHGVYQQENRDERVARRKAGLPKQHEFMVRIRLPGGRLSASQWLAIDAADRQLGNGGGLRLTSRQAVQFHGLEQGELKPLLGVLDQALMTTLGACGDVGRNLMVTPAPLDDEPHRLAWRMAQKISERLELRTHAYRELWIDGERAIEELRATVEPLYGSSYLPRKFKVGVTVAGENTIDVYTHDVGLIVVESAGQPGAGLLVGGGLGMTHRKADTFARLGTPLAWVPEDEVAEVVEAIALIFRDHGERKDRRHARLKYLLEEWGGERFKSLVEESLGRPLAPWVDPGPFEAEDLLGGHAQGRDRSFLGILVPSGRLLDESGGLREALREIAREEELGLVVTPTQNLLLTDLADEQLVRVRDRLEKVGVTSPRQLSGAQRFAMACPALPTCGLALADAERVLPEVVGSIEAALVRLGLADLPLAIRITGCPNGCARPYSADLGIVGRSPGVYDLYVGGGLSGDRLGELFEEKVPRLQIAETLWPLLESWGNNRLEEEGLGDYYWRLRPPSVGPVDRSLRSGSKEPTRSRLPLVTHSTTADRARQAHSAASFHEPPAVPVGSQSSKGTAMSNNETNRSSKPSADRPNSRREGHESLPRIGDEAPDFTALTTRGTLTLGEWQGDDWVVLFSHPADFTPVCTTELAAFAQRQGEFRARDVKLIGLSIDSIHAHLAWVESIRENLGVDVDYPLVADLDQAVAQRYGLLHPGESETATVRALFVIDPTRTVRAVIYYPLNVGRNIDEVLRLVDALQTAARHSVALPVDWQPGGDVVVPPPKTLEDVSARRSAKDQVHTFYLHTRSLGAEGAVEPAPGGAER